MVKRISGWWAGIQPTTIVLGTGLPVRHGSGHAKRTQRAVTACGATTVAWPARAHRRTRGPGEGGATTVGAAATHLVRWRRWGLTRAAGRLRGTRNAAGHRRSKAAVGSDGWGGHRRGPAARGGDRGGEGPLV
jgi:hypothetical protein